ncbi:retinal guanylyl cyclase 2-like [Ornithodoros turicata]|uniref:retinal guanylyl cyclase 2-like n=1 Tax=Ornithodoros turicata TaxID=34597 RepID=UPI0031390B14
MEIWGSLLGTTLTALHRQGRDDGTFALFLVSSPTVLHPGLAPRLPATAKVLRALFVLTFVPVDSSYAQLWRNRTVQQIYRKVVAQTTATEVYSAFRYFNALSLIITAAWRSLQATQRSEVSVLNASFTMLPAGGHTDPRGNIRMKAVLLDYSPAKQVFVAVRELEIRDVPSSTVNGRGTYVVSDRAAQAWITDVDWPSGRPLEPDPECVLREVVCGGTWSNFPLTSAEAVGITASLIICISAGLGVAGLVRRKLAVKQMRRKILLAHDDIQVSAAVKRGAFEGYYFERPDIFKGSHDSLRQTFGNSSLTSIHASVDERPNAARLKVKGDVVYLKYLIVHSTFEIKTKSMKQLQIMYEIRQENVNPFLGCLADPVQPALVWEMCTRGSLMDVLATEDIRLDWTFRLSLLNDLVKGMRYLHNSPIRQHGHLTSRNCVIDSRWVLKITDYGIPAFQDLQAIATLVRSAKDLLWTAPELLRDCGLLRRGTQAGDVYSFAIIMQEVLLRGDPYCMILLTPEEIIEKLKHPPPLIRPSVSKQTAPPEALHIMRQCWAEYPDMRPDFDQVAERFKALYHGRKSNIVETMFQMLEKYSNNLEDLIRERTVQLDEEKKKTEQLLNRMLPSSVAETLKAGLPVVPEKFEEVTVYFSDIVGFTTISAYSEPMEIVDLLNDLYTAFDSTINHYNVYKVETIGDAYMVVGGLPERTRDHAEQVATMALDLLHVCGNFKIRHMPTVPLMLRIGMHTGPVVAGVVGLTMPRYCLFGDTVNTASRMESTGRAYRIHMSKATERKLRHVGGYDVQYRGEIVLKGRGRQPTYWLIGKQGFEKSLPIPPTEENGNNHGFKDEEIFKALGRKKSDDILDAPHSPLSPYSKWHGMPDARCGPDVNRTPTGVRGLICRASIASSQIDACFLPDNELATPTDPNQSPLNPSRSWNGSPTGPSSRRGRLRSTDSSGTNGVLKKNNRIADRASPRTIRLSWSEVNKEDHSNGLHVEDAFLRSWPSTRSPSPSFRRTRSLRLVTTHGDGEKAKGVGSRRGD